MKKAIKFILQWGTVLAIAFLLSMLIRTYLIDNRIVPTGSMIPTIEKSDRLFIDKLFYKSQELQRGDIITFRAPPAAKEDLDLVKRIIGLPGETVEIKDGLVFIDGLALNEPYLNVQPYYTFGPLTISEGDYFVLGDNRNGSLDSHVWGGLPEEYINGRVWVRYYPFDRFGPLAKPPEDYWLEYQESVASEDIFEED